MRYFVPVICALFLLSCKGKERLPVQFYEEEVCVWVERGEVLVEGIYYFRNRTHTAKRMRLFYPFPIDSLHEFPYEIEVEGTPFETAEDGVTYDVIIDSMGVAESTVRYKQRIFTNCAKYILMTARRWKEPIEEARFVVSLPEDFSNVNISYEPDSIIKKEERTFYYINEHNLFPDRDIDIVWKLAGREKMTIYK
ncbi:hypothetical protein CH333_06445 [candidate division WOR-3 bacterium JGI_Cruoil_03_44_89]|uniref:DUF4424 domain-containing protein n=1 Tax=candidate division WOR-3 bacterium JGI_Cruoil_03_44_89 TaxID=1973748 RepID=A0A235BTU4_UNCW3|nr:MAG: hypothetical protein CH333_06445 [candidate division WOR-3 bacterium JGI_Cruoil_03_44_89]